MNQRSFIGMMAGGLLAAPLAGAGQLAGKVPRIGVIVPAEPDSPTEPNIAAFRRELRGLGHVDGQNVAISYRYAHGKAELYAAFAAELARLPVDIMVVGSAAATLAAKTATQTVPIVMIGGGDPVRSGVVVSLARPGGNITGVSMWIGEDVFGKWVELLKDAVPRVSHVAYLRDPSNPVGAPFLRNAPQTTRALGVNLQVLELHEPRELETTLSAVSRQPGGSFITVGEAARNLRPPRVRRGRRPDVLWSEPPRSLAAGRDLRGQDPERGDTWRLGRRAAHAIRAGHQPQDRSCPRLDDPAIVLQRADQVIDP